MFLSVFFLEFFPVANLEEDLKNLDYIFNENLENKFLLVQSPTKGCNHTFFRGETLIRLFTSSSGTNDFTESECPPSQICGSSLKPRKDITKYCWGLFFE